MGKISKGMVWGREIMDKKRRSKMEGIRKGLFSMVIGVIIVLLFSGINYGMWHPLKEKAKISQIGRENVLVNEAGKSKVRHKEGEVLVKFRRGISRNEVLNITSSYGLSVSKEFRILSQRRGQTYVLLKSKGLSTQEMIKILKKDPAVESVSPNYIRHIMSTFPNDPHFDELWGLHNTGQTGGTADADIDAPEAWDITRGDTEIVLADIDTGVDYTHEDLADNMWKNLGEDWVGDAPGNNGIDDDGNGYVDDYYGIDAYNNDSDPMDDHGHGTHTSGTMAAVGNNNTGVTGVNWQAKIMALKFLSAGGSGSDADAITCIEYVINMKTNYGVNVVAINASWGGGGYDQALKDAIEEAGNAGILFCAAAGNSGTNNDTDPSYPASYDSPSIVAVAATDDNDEFASWSNYGVESVDLSAPGVDILSTLPGGGYNPQPGDIFFDDMESGDGNWTHGGTNDTWAITEAQSYSPTHSWDDSPGGNYVNDTDSWIAINHDIDLSGTSGQQICIGFWAKVDIETYFDALQIEVSPDSGSTWYSIASIDGHETSWTLYSYLIPETYRTSQFRFRLRLVTDYSVTYDGVYIDNVGIGIGGGSTNYDSWSGTSMATPHVTGAVGLLAAEYPGESITQRKMRILFGVDTVPSLAGKVLTGGRLNLYNSLQPDILNRSYIEEITPTEGMVPGTSFTITGTNFGSSPGRVVFTDLAGDETDAEIISWSDTQIEAQVPSGTGKYVKVIDTSGNESCNAIAVSAWTQKEPSNTGTSDSTAVAYNGKIYRFGGYTSGGSGTTSAAEMYDPATDTWISLASMLTARANLTAAEVGGEIYVIGGYDDSTNTVLDTVEAYNPSTNTWETKAPLPQAMSFMKAVSLNGKIYVTGGYDSSYNAVDTLYEYDPSTNTWTQKASMSTARFEHGAVAINGKIYIFGGSDDTSYLNSCEVYDPATDTWSPIAAMPIPLARMGAATDGQYVYLAGGTNNSWWYDQLPVFLRYDPQTDTWEYQANDINELITAKSTAPLVYISGDGLYSVNGLIGGPASSSELEFLSLSVVSPGNPVIMSIEDGYGAPGTSRNIVTISADNQTQNTTPIASGEFWITYDSSIGINVPDTGGVETTERSQNHQVAYSVDRSSSTHVVHILLFSQSGDTISSDTGPILKLLFDVDSGATLLDESTLAFNNVILSDIEGNPIPVDYSDTGTFTIEGEKGDINGDGEENILDIQLKIYRILHGEWPDNPDLPPVTYMEWAADDNDDGVINILDLQLEINRILGR